MKKQVLILLALASVPQAVAQTHPVRVKLRVVLIDKDLNQKTGAVCGGEIEVRQNSCGGSEDGFERYGIGRSSGRALHSDVGEFGGIGREEVQLECRSGYPRLGARD